jgi:hypothetical protein
VEVREVRSGSERFGRFGAVRSVPGLVFVFFPIIWIKHAAVFVSFLIIWNKSPEAWRLVFGFY